LIGLVYKLLTPLLKKYVKVRMRYNGWILIFLCLVIPFRPQFMIPLIEFTLPMREAQPVLGEGGYLIGMADFDLIPPIDVTVGNALDVSQPVVLAGSSFVGRVSIWTIVTGIWLIGVVICLSYSFVKHGWYMKQLKRWRQVVVSEETLTMFNGLKRELNVVTKAGLFVCPLVQSPMVIGVFRPMIVLPHEDFSREELHFVLKHELVHMRQKDVWVKGLLMVATALHWFNPLVVLMGKESKVVCEMACDFDVINGYPLDKREMYVKTILAVIRKRGSFGSTLATQFYGGKKGMKNRVMTIMDKEEKRFGISLVAVLLLLVVTTGVVFAVSGETTVQPEDTFIRDAREYVEERLNQINDGVQETGDVVEVEIYETSDVLEISAELLDSVSIEYEIFEDESGGLMMRYFPYSLFAENTQSGEWYELIEDEFGNLTQIQRADWEMANSLGMLYLPSIDIELPIFDGIGEPMISRGAGVITPDAQMGEGNFVMTSHWTPDPAVLFGGLHLVQVGDLIILENDGYRFTYEVITGDNYIIEAYRIDILDEVPGKRYVTLFTCTPDWTQRVKVRGELIDVQPLY